MGRDGGQMDILEQMKRVRADIRRDPFYAGHHDASHAWMDEAAAEIARLRAECLRLEDHINDADDESIRLRAEVERLTGTIKRREKVIGMKQADNERLTRVLKDILGMSSAFEQAVQGQPYTSQSAVLVFKQARAALATDGK